MFPADQPAALNGCDPWSWLLSISPCPRAQRLSDGAAWGLSGDVIVPVAPARERRRLTRHALYGGRRPTRSRVTTASRRSGLSRSPQLSGPLSIRSDRRCPCLFTSHLRQRTAGAFLRRPRMARRGDLARRKPASAAFWGVLVRSTVRPISLVDPARGLPWRMRARRLPAHGRIPTAGPADRPRDDRRRGVVRARFRRVGDSVALLTSTPFPAYINSSPTARSGAAREFRRPVRVQRARAHAHRSCLPIVTARASTRWFDSGAAGAAAAGLKCYTLFVPPTEGLAYGRLVPRLRRDRLRRSSIGARARASSSVADAQGPSAGPLPEASVGGGVRRATSVPRRGAFPTHVRRVPLLRLRARSRRAEVRTIPGRRRPSRRRRWCQLADQRNRPGGNV